MSPPDRQHASQAGGRPAITSKRPAKRSRNHPARIKAVSSAQAGPYVRIACHFTRQSIAKLTGPETERMIEPLEMNCSTGFASILTTARS